jgi:zinc protease
MKPELTEEFWVNGLKVIFKPNPANEIVSVQLYLRGGSLNLDESTQGIEPLIFESAQKGTKRYPKEKLNDILDKTASSISYFSNRDYTILSLGCIKRYFDETWDVFTDIILNPAFDSAEVELAREKMLVDIRQRRDSPDTYLGEIANEIFFEGHPYRLNPQGVEASVSSITIDRMKNYLNDNLETSKLLLVVVGNVDKRDLKKKVEDTFGKLPKGDYKPVYPKKVQHSAPDMKIIERDLPTNYIIGYFSAPGLREPDYYSMTMAIDILRWRVWEEVRTKRNLSYAPSAFYSTELANRAAIYVTAVDPDTTIKVMLAELKKMQTEPVSEKDLKDRIAMYITRYYLRNETNAAQAQFLAQFELSGLGWQESEKFVENLRKVTAEDVQRVANQYFRNIQFAVLGNPELIDEKLFTSM